MPGKRLIKDRLFMALVLIGIMAVVAGIVAAGLLAPGQARYLLGDKDQVLSNLKEYFAREPDIAVRIENETAHGTNVIEYKYDLISDIDSQNHGWIRILSDSKARVYAVYILWIHNGNDNLQRSGDLIVSAIADSTIPDWQKVDDGQQNRNSEILRWIDSNAEYDRTYEKDDLSERRELSFHSEENQFFLGVIIEP